MFSTYQKARSLLHTMLVTGIILIPTAIATPAVQELVDMRSVINAAASAIGDPNNPNRGFGFNLFGGSGQIGTADLVNNITNTILRGKFQLDTNRVCVFHLTKLTYGHY
jgi:Tfp pilus assembly major pilin PilA